jgi:hypothetical protein
MNVLQPRFEVVPYVASFSQEPLIDASKSYPRDFSFAP